MLNNRFRSVRGLIGLAQRPTLRWQRLTKQANLVALKKHVCHGGNIVKKNGPKAVRTRLGDESLSLRSSLSIPNPDPRSGFKMLELSRCLTGKRMERYFSWAEWQPGRAAARGQHSLVSRSGCKAIRDSS
jgi:hypothetical protein